MGHGRRERSDPGVRARHGVRHARRGHEADAPHSDPRQVVPKWPRHRPLPHRISSSPFLSSKFQLNLVIEMSLLQHFAQGSGANLIGQSLLFIVFKIVLVRLVVMMRRVELLLFNHLFFNDSAAGRIGRCDGCRLRRRRLAPRLVLPFSFCRPRPKRRNPVGDDGSTR